MAEFKRTTSKAKNIKPMLFELDISSNVQPLALLINPNSLEIKYTPKIIEQRVRWTTQNIPYIFHAHHDELDIMSCSGKSAMFISDKGITRVDRVKTLAFENIEDLIAIYRNNGTNRNKKPNSSINPSTIDSVGRVSISYDNFIYKGHFLNLTISENDSSPFNLDFSFEFKITKTFDSLEYDKTQSESRYNININSQNYLSDNLRNV